MNYIFEVEGGYSNIPDDHGGATNFGITEGDLSDYLGYPATPAMVKAMDKSVARSIYEDKYWAKLSLELVDSAKIQAVIMDQGVNCGIGHASLSAQRVLNSNFSCGLVEDSRLGPLTAASLNTVVPLDFCDFYIDAAREYYREIASNNPSQRIFLRGWLNRMDKLEALVLTLG